MTAESLQDLAGHDLIIILNVLTISDVHYAFVIDRHHTVMIALPDTPSARLKSILIDKVHISATFSWFHIKRHGTHFANQQEARGSVD